MAKKARKTTTKSKPKPQSDLIGWAWASVFGTSGKEATKGKGPRFSEDAVGWLIAWIKGKQT